MKTINPGKQRKNFYNAPLHKKRKWLASHLEENLLLKYDKRSLPVVKGDTVRVMRGSFRGHEDKIAKVHVKKNTVEVEGLFLTKADGKKIAKPVDPSNIMITKLNLTDKWRRRKLESNLSEEAKKEMEKEAAQQIRELEEEKKRIEAEEKAKEAALETEKEESFDEEVLEKTEELDKKPVEEVKTSETQKTKTSEKPKKETKTVKKEEKTPSKKPPVKKEEDKQ